ncbi:MAG: hypothetical protein U9N85_07285, partial [Bacteroidota bacterium]|nr:hypothetical protein [Bacteroidota bacterium]
MYKAIPIILLLFLAQALSAQDYEYRGDEYYSYDEELNLYLEADYKSRRKTKSEYIFRLLKVYTNTGSQVGEIQSEMLDDSCSRNQSFAFDKDHSSFSRKFVLIKGASCFYIYNLKNKKLSKPQIPIYWKINKEAESGLIETLKITKTGKAVFGSTSDNGCFLFNLKNINSANEMLPYNIPFFGENRFFLIPTDISEHYNGVYVYLENGDVYKKTLFSKKYIKAEDRSRLKNLTTEAKEKVIMAATLEQNRYTLLNSPGNTSNTPFIVVD